MNAAMDSTRPTPGATTNRNLDALDALDFADQFLVAIQLICVGEGNGAVIDALASAVRDRHDQLREMLERGHA
jgi:hypothetical protein